MWSPNRKIKNVESKILHLICSLNTISAEIKIVKVTACTLYAAMTTMTNTTTREFSTLPQGVNTHNLSTTAPGFLFIS